ncbi:MAG TPA: hypothetical protein VLW50_27275 [Streptosporangiaceae bacterium]|nr:hypothetical protein [Streptosporangiaceae bacterium]
MNEFGYQVHLPVLATAGAGAGAAAAKVSSSTGTLTGATSKAIGAHPGWQSSVALQKCLEAWEARLRALAAEVKHISDNLGQTTRQYQHAEQEIVAQITRVAAQLRELKAR